MSISGCGAARLSSMAPATVVEISASPVTIRAGENSTLSVTASNATNVMISGSDGSSYTLQPSGGTQSVSPKSTTTYQATATGSKGDATATATITVTSGTAPTVSISANPNSIAAGGSALLTIAATNSTQIVVKGSDNSSYTLPGTGGTQAVSPSATATYTATATGAGGSATATATVIVSANPAPTVSVVANPPSISAGATSTLQVTASYATAVSISGSDGSSYTLQSPNGGTQAVTPSQTTSYTVTASGPGGSSSAVASVTVTAVPSPAVSITANPTTIVAGHSSLLTVTASNATQVTISGSDGSNYNLAGTGGTQTVSPSSSTTYTASATSSSGTATASVTVAVTTTASIQSIDHVIFMMQENHAFDSYFGMLNPYRRANNWTVASDGTPAAVDGIDDKLNTITNSNDEGMAYKLFKSKSTCLDDMSSAWLESFGDVNRYDFSSTRGINMDGFVHNAEGFAKQCVSSGTCSGSYTDTAGQRAMAYYDQDFLNYYYYMASQFALSDRWFSPVATNTIDNRIATFTGGTTQGLVHEPGQDNLSQLSINSIFAELDNAKISWKIYYTVTEGYCLDEEDCPKTGNARYPASTFENLSYSYQYISSMPSSGQCTSPKQPSSVVGDSTNSFCIDPNHIAPISQYFTDVANGTLPSFAFIEPGFGQNDEHPGSGNDILLGQAQVSKVINALMKSPSWKDSVFFLSYDEGGGPYDHVPPVPGHSNDATNAALGTIPDVSKISVNPDSYMPCLPAGGTPTVHCDLRASDPGAKPTDAAAVNGFGAQIGFRVPNIVISPFVKAHYVSHAPMDHSAIIKFVETRFIGGSAHLTARDAAQPDLLDFFDFTNVPWATPPTPPAPVTSTTLGYNSCTPSNMGP